MLNLVTGGAGFLGSHLVDALVTQGDDVIIADNLSTGTLGNVADALRGGRATFVYVDVAQPLVQFRQAILEAARRNPIGRIFHFASPSGREDLSVRPARPWEALTVNAIGTVALIDLAVEQQARLIFASACPIYGDPLVHPQLEAHFGDADAIGLRACYEEGKRFGEAALSVAVARRGLDGRIVRFFNCYGPRMNKGDGRLISALAEAISAGLPLPIHGTGLQRRSMTFVDDAIRLLLMVADAAQMPLEPINIGSDEEHSVIEVAELFAKIAGSPFVVNHAPPRPGDPPFRRPDLTAAFSLGYRPRTTLDKGLEKTLAWLRHSAGVYV